MHLKRNVVSTAETRGPGRGRFQFEVTEIEARRRLYFPYMSRSDIHWGTQYSRAKRLSHMEENTIADEDDYIGDIYDGVAVREKERWNLGPWHRQGMAHGFRKAGLGSLVKVFKGNHEHGINRKIIHDGEWKDHRNLDGKEIYGVKFLERESRLDPKGRNVLRVHGDEFDDHLFKKAWLKGMMYSVGDYLYHSLYEADRLVRLIPPLEHFSLAAVGKKLVKTVINELLGVHKAMAAAIDDSPFDVCIYGHSHMPGFDWTPEGKLLVNDGCCTEHVNALVQDEHGTLAILTWHKDHVEVEEEPSTKFGESIKYKISYEELDFEEALEPPLSYEDEYTEKADRFTRLLYMTWPPKERSNDVREMRLTENFIHGYALYPEKKSLLPQVGMEFHRAMWRSQELQGPRPVPVERPKTHAATSQQNLGQNPQKTPQQNPGQNHSGTELELSA